MLEELKGQNNTVLCEMPPRCKGCFDRFGEIPMVTDDAAMIVGGKVRILPAEVSEFEKELLHVSAVMTEDGKLYCVGRNEYEARTCLSVLEKNADIYLNALLLGEPRILDDEHCHSEHEGYLGSYSKSEKNYQDGCIIKSNDMVSMSEREAALREAIVEYGLKLQDTGLVTGTWGNLSVRFDDSHMLCTPSGIDYSHMTLDQIVMVDLDTLEWTGDFKPTSEKILHAMLYKKFPEAGAIIHTHSSCSTAYAAAGATLDGETSEDGPFRILSAKYGLAGTKELAENVCEASAGSTFGCFMRSHGLIVFGADLDEALYRAKLVEDTAKQKLYALSDN